MRDMIGYCGVDCEKCDAYIATVNDDQTLREKTAKLWAELNNAPILPEHINCVGCRTDGVKTVFCEHMCEVRKCALRKGVSTCGNCPELQICETVGAIISNNPVALENLLSIRNMKMTREEYIARMNSEDDWAPGWDAIEEEFNRLYPGREPSHYGTEIHARAMFGGDNYLDGYSIYDSGKGYQHIVTFGMSELYTDEDAFGGEYSRWGYEMTIKLKEGRAEDCLWALDMLSNLARYTYTTERFFEAGACVPGNGTSLHIGTDSLITALIAVNDTSAQTLDTVHGKVEFIQFVGITETELNKIREDLDNLPILIENMKKENPELITDMKRKKSYL